MPGCEDFGFAALSPKESFGFAALIPKETDGFDAAPSPNELTGGELAGAAGESTCAARFVCT